MVAGVAEYLWQHMPEFERDLSALLAQQSVSEGARGVAECASLLAGLLGKCSLDEAGVAETEGLPGVWGYFDAGKPHTLGVYAMFDHAVVQRPWKRAPYAPVVEGM